MFIIFTTHTCMWCPQCSRQAWNMEKLTFSRYKYCIILILSRKKMIWTLLCKLWLYFTLALHPSDQHVLHYITTIKHLFGKLNSFLQNLCDLIKYIMKYNRYGQQRITISFKATHDNNEIIQHFCLNVTINHYWVFVVTSDCDPVWILSNDEAEICC